MHEGHRRRLMEKLRRGDNLFEHELLEILLFNAYPRANVNPVAHALLQRFASINEVISADVDELMLVEGVGENAALYLKCVGECMRLKNNCDSFTVIRNAGEFMQFAGDSKLVAHNARFDLSFLQESLHRSSLTPWTAGAYDSISLIRKAYPGMPSYSLQSLRTSFSLGEGVMGDAHRALYDAELTAEIFAMAMKRLYELYG